MPARPMQRVCLIPYNPEIRGESSTRGAPPQAEADNDCRLLMAPRACHAWFHEHVMHGFMSMNACIGAVSLLVREYDEAIEFYTTKLPFRLIEDTPQTSDKRWVRVRPPGPGGCDLILARAATPQQQERVGDQTGGRVFLFLYTDDFSRNYEAMKSKGIGFTEQPRQEAYGRVVVFRDLYGNRWDLVEKNSV